MADYTYAPFLLIDDVTGDVVRNAAGGQLLDQAGGVVQPVYDLLDAPVASLTTNAKGVGAAFKADVPFGVVSFGSIALPVISVEAQQSGLEAAAAQAAAEAAQESAAESATSAAAAQSSAQAAAALVDAPADDAVATLVASPSSAARAAVLAAGSTSFVAQNDIGTTVPSPAQVAGKVDKNALVFDALDYPGATDTEKANAAIVAANAAGGGTVLLSPTHEWELVRRTVGVQMGGGLRLLPGVNVDGQGATLTLADNTEFIYGASTITTIGTVTADTTESTTVLTLDTTAGLAVGDDVFVRLGTAAYDSAEPAHYLFAKVAAVDATTVTLDRPVAYAMTVASTSTANRRVQKVTDFIHDVSITGVRLVNPMTGDANAEAGVHLRYARNVHVELVGKDCGAGVLLAQFCENITGTVHAESAAAQNGQASKGRIVTLSSCISTDLWRVSGERVQKQAITAEAGCENTRVRSLHVVNNYPGRSTTTEALVSQLEDGHMTIDAMTVEGYGTLLRDVSGTSGSTFRVGELIDRTGGQLNIQALSDIDAMLVDGVWYREVRRHAIRARVMPSQAEKILTLPQGLLRRVKVYVSDKTGITGFYVSRDSSFNGSDLKASLVNATVVDLSSGRAGYGPSYPLNNTTGKRILYASDGAVVAGAFLVVEVEFFVPASVTGTAGANPITYHGQVPINDRPTISGSRGGNAALASLLTALADMSLITDSTTA